MRIAPIDMKDDFDPTGGFPDEATLCVECDHVHPDSKSKSPFQWRCLKFPAPPMGGFVDPSYRPSPPYHRCEKINNGQCQHWTPIKTPKEAHHD